MSTEISYTQSYHQLEKRRPVLYVSLVMTLSLFHDYKGDSQLRIFGYTSAYGYCGQLVIGEGYFRTYSHISEQELNGFY
jgi:hypothetical protein